MLHKIISENFFVSRFFCVWYAIAPFFAKNNCICARAMLFRRLAAGGFYKKTRVFSVCFGVRLRGVVTNRWGRAAWFLTITGWCYRFWIDGLNIGNVPHGFCVYMPSARCIMLRIVGWSVYVFSAYCPVRTGVAWLCGAQKRLLAWLIPDFSGIFCIIFRVRRGFRGGVYYAVALCGDVAIRHLHTPRYIRGDITLWRKAAAPGRAVFSVRA